MEASIQSLPVLAHLRKAVTRGSLTVLASLQLMSTDFAQNEEKPTLFSGINAYSLFPWPPPNPQYSCQDSFASALADGTLGHLGHRITHRLPQADPREIYRLK